MPKPSIRANEIPSSPIRRLVPFADAAKAEGVKIYHLNIGQPDIETPRAMRERLGQLDADVLEYSPSCGTAEYVDSIIRYYEKLGIALQPGEVMATTGGSEAILFALLATTNHGDEVIVVEPFYSNYNGFAAMAGVRLIPVTAHVEDGFHLPPFDQWEAKLTRRTRSVLLCSPNNPTGTVYTDGELEAVAAFCRTHNLFLITDEVYREFVYDGRTSRSALTLEGMNEFVIVTDSLSKRYSACGIRLGSFITRNREIYDAALRMAQARLSPPGLAQFIAVGANELGPAYAADVLREYQHRRDVLSRELEPIPDLYFHTPEGAFYLVVRLAVEDAEDFARWLLTDFRLGGETVMLTPAAGFYATPGLGRDEVRIAYVLKEEDLVKAARILGAALAEYRASVQSTHPEQVRM